MFKTLYHFDLHNEIANSQAHIGIQDSTNKSLGYVTLGGKINIFSPNQENQESSLTNTLNINKAITCICFGLGDAEDTSELLFIGSETSLMCYDIKINKTVFDKDVMEGVYCMVSGMYSIYPTPLCIVGGNCSVTGIDAKGEDKFWTVLGGNAICMTLFDVNEDGYNELVVGTDDFAIRFYQNENVINEINENTKIINVAVIEGFKFVYALENGTVGLRNSTDRLWKMKENGYVTAIVIDDFNKDNIYEILLGWSNGKIQLLAQEKGKILIEFDVQQPLSTILFGSLTSNEEDHLVALTQKGEVFGYKYCEELDGDTETQFVSKDKGVSPQDLQRYNLLLKEKRELIEKLEDIAIKNSNKSKVNSPKDDIVLPKNTEVKIDLQSNNDNKCADLIMESSPEGTVIQSVIIMSEQIYQGESYVHFPPTETNKIVIQIKTKKDLKINLHIKVLVGKSYYLSDYQVFEFNKIIPKYCFYILLREEIAYKNELIQGISFKYNDTINRLIIWLEEYFNIAKKELETFRSGENEYRIRFMSLRTDKVLQISAKDNVLSIFTEEIELAGNILQDMCIFFKLNDLNTVINYTEVVKGFTGNIEKIKELDKERNQYSINMTEIITFIKDLFVKAEDNRLLDNIQGFKDYFRKINVKNLELLDEFEKRSTIFTELINQLKIVNEIIQIFSNLKVGKFKQEMVNQCRKCIREKKYALLIKIISTGSE